MTKKRVVVGMSGGVDSSVAAALLQGEGHEVIGVHLVLWPHCSPAGGEGSCCGTAALEASMGVAEKLSIPLRVEDVSEGFRSRVIDYFIDEYGRGRTPNPCVVCNRAVKFEALLRLAGDIGAAAVATGHYAAISGNGRPGLLRAADAKYDQTYFLSRLTRDQLSRSLFPLGQVEKERTRALAGEMGLSVRDRRSSHDVCFIQGEDYRDFLRARRPELARKGVIVDAAGEKIGEHDGTAFYTVGQRHGLGIGGGSPLYVISIDPDAHRLTVGGEEDLYRGAMRVGDCSWIPFDEPPPAMDCTVKIRYGASGTRARVTRTGHATAEVVFDEAQRAIAAGQAAVFYRGEEVLGGGFIESSFTMREA